jgi:hypothetical protein
MTFAHWDGAQAASAARHLDNSLADYVQEDSCSAIDNVPTANKP